MLTYKKLYAMLLGDLSDAVDLLRSGRVAEAADLLQAACLRAEDAILDAPEETLPDG